MDSAELARLRQRFGMEPLEVKCAVDGLSLYVNVANPIMSLTVQQIRALFTGAITNWKDVGGSERPVVLYGRESISGTYMYFKEHVLLDHDFAVTTRRMSSTATIVDAVSKDAGGIGYGGVAYGKGIREVKVKADSVSTAYAPTLENLRTERYPICRYLFMYLKSRPSGAIKDYVEWILSEDGQRIVDDVGYVPIQ
jgi:phosphate transport system substrate-binding protein